MQYPKILLTLLLLIVPKIAISDDGIYSSCFSISNDNKNKLVHKRFTQSRFIRGLSKPIISSGEFNLYPDEKIEWVTKKPFESIVTVSKEGFEIAGSNRQLEQDMGENTDRAVEKFDDSYFKELGSILVALHSTSLTPEALENLKSKFHLKCTKENDLYRLEATPASRILGKILKNISITGQNSPSNIKIEDARGDTTEIVLK